MCRKLCTIPKIRTLPMLARLPVLYNLPFLGSFCRWSWVLCLARFPWLFSPCVALCGYVWRSVCCRSGCLFALPACRGFLRVQVARVRSLAVAAFGRFLWSFPLVVRIVCKFSGFGSSVPAVHAVGLPCFRSFRMLPAVALLAFCFRRSFFCIFGRIAAFVRWSLLGVVLPCCLWSFFRLWAWLCLVCVSDFGRGFPWSFFLLSGSFSPSASRPAFCLFVFPALVVCWLRLSVFPFPFLCSRFRFCLARFLVAVCLLSFVLLILSGVLMLSAFVLL